MWRALWWLVPIVLTVLTGCQGWIATSTRSRREREIRRVVNLELPRALTLD